MNYEDTIEKWAPTTRWLNRKYMGVLVDASPVRALGTFPIFYMFLGADPRVVRIGKLEYLITLLQPNGRTTTFLCNIEKLITLLKKGSFTK